MHDIADARIEIGEALATVRGSGKPAEVISRARAIPVTIALAAVALLAAAVWWRPLVRLSPTPPAAQALEFGITFPNNFMNATGAVISPDGRQIAANVWSNWGDIWMASLDGSPPRPLPGAEQASYPFWSPDSSTIGFFTASQLVAMRATGGPRTSIATVAGPSGGGWSRDGVILYAARGTLFQVSAS